MNVLFVCLENVCRSPMAQVIAQERWARRTGTVIGCRFASTGVLVSMRNAPLDPRARAALERHGYRPQKHRARRWTSEDLDRFDHIVAMDASCLRALMEGSEDPLADPGPSSALPAKRMSLLLDWSAAHAGLDVPDPYFGPAAGFDEVVRLCEAGIDAFFDRAIVRDDDPLQAGGSRW